MQDARCKMQDARYKMQDTRCKIQEHQSSYTSTTENLHFARTSS
jgi:hypothetical protein